jgi:hypothetical protein
MIVKKGFIPPNLDLETPKPSLKLDERKIKVRKDLLERGWTITDNH